MPSSIIADVNFNGFMNKFDAAKLMQSESINLKDTTYLKAIKVIKKHGKK